MSIKVALAGNPNCGKTTLYNAITGSNEYVGNRPGVTVEEKEARLKWNKDVTIMDLPGIYSLSPYTSEEVVTREYIINKTPDVILNVIDASNIERNLYLTTQLIETGLPIVIALNMMDIIEKDGDKIDVAKLEKELNCPIVPVSALKGKGLKEVCEKAVSVAGKKVSQIKIYDTDVESFVSQTEEILADKDFTISKRWFAVKLFEKDEEVLKNLKIDSNKKAVLDQITKNAEDKYDDDTESIITNERYSFIEKTVSKTVKRNTSQKLSLSDKIDKIVTNRILAIPIFAVIMWFVYYISVSSLGGIATVWANDGVFGDGWHLPFTGGEYEEAVGEFDTAQAEVEAFVAAAEEAGIDVDSVNEALGVSEPEELADDADADAIAEYNEASEEFAAASDTIDEFVADTKDITAVAEIENEDGEVEETIDVDNAEFAKALEVSEPDPAEYGVWVPGIPVFVEDALDSMGASEWVKSLVLDGIVGGVGSVLGFVPQILILFFLLAILEDCGYMARIAFIMDRIFRKFGLSGKSFIPVLIGTGCGVPGVMASRTIENNNDRRLTIMTTTFIPCSAKLPIIALIAGAIFGGASWVAPSAYFLGIAMIIFSGVVLKRLSIFHGDPAPFVMELPAYHIPAIKGLFIHMWDKGKAFIKKAGTIIFLACALIWFFSTFNWSLDMVETPDSMLADIGKFIAPIFEPLGFGHWQAAVASITGLVAKENVVGTFGVLYGFDEVAEDGVEMWSMVANDFTVVSAYAFLAFNLLCAPCFAAMGAIRREMASAKWTAFAIIYQTLLAYVVALLINLYGNAIVYGGSFVAPIILTVVIVALIAYIFANSKKNSKKAVMA